MTPEEQAILTLITSAPGYQVQVFGELYVYRLEDGTFAVGVEGGKEAIFTDAGDAVEIFETIRRQMKLGFEFERKRSDMDTIDLLKSQILAKRPGMLHYQLKERVYCPHMLGRTKDGRIVLQAYQIGGVGAPERDTGWRFFYLDGVSDVRDHTATWQPEKLEKAEDPAKAYVPPKFVTEILALVAP